MIRRLWSPTGLLCESLRFGPGLNLIVGRYANMAPSENINGIGKSTLVRLIDYLLLSETAEKTFNKPRYRFMKEERHELCLDLELKGAALRIRRRFGDRGSVFLQRGEEGEFRYTVEEAKVLLDTLFFPEEASRQLPGVRFRSLMPFFIKDDLKSQTRIDPIEFISHRGTNKQELMTLNLFLLGLPNAPLVRMGEQVKVLQETQKSKKRLQQRIEVETGKKVQALRTELGTQRKELAQLQASLSDLNQSGDFQAVSQILVQLDDKIRDLRGQVEKSDRQLSRLERFVKVPHEVDLTDISEQYAQVSRALGSAIRKSLEEVMTFRQSLAEERLRFHGEQMRHLTDYRRDTLMALDELEGQRAALLRSVSNDGTASLSEAFARLAKRQVEVERVASTLEDIAQADILAEDQARQAEMERHNTITALRGAAERIEAIRERFIDIVDNVIKPETVEERENAWLDIETRQGSIKTSPVDIKVQVPREDALGRHQGALVAYDFTVFFNAVAQRLQLPRFLIHDGAYHSISRRTVVAALNYVVQQEHHWEDEPFQYIATFNEDELPLAEALSVRDGGINFNVEERTVITLTPEKRLLGRSFA